MLQSGCKKQFSILDAISLEERKCQIEAWNRRYYRELYVRLRWIYTHMILFLSLSLSLCRTMLGNKTAESLRSSRPPVWSPRSAIATRAFSSVGPRSRDS
jgi:hypothetical protein